MLSEVIVLIPWDGKVCISETLQSCRYFGLQSCVILNGEALNVQVQSDFSIVSESSNLSGILNDGLRYLETIESINVVLRLDAGSVFVCLPTFSRQKEVVLALQARFNSYLLGFRCLGFVLSTMYDNPFSHSGLSFPLREGIYYDINFDRAQDYELMLRLKSRFKFRIVRGSVVRKFRNLKSASFSDRRNQILYSIKAIRGHFSILNPIGLISIALRAVRLK